MMVHHRKNKIPPQTQIRPNPRSKTWKRLNLQHRQHRRLHPHLRLSRNQKRSKNPLRLKCQNQGTAAKLGYVAPKSHHFIPIRKVHAPQVKMPRIRLRIAERLLEAQHTTASLTTFNEIDMSSLISLRASSKESVLANHGVKLGFMGAFARACALVLKEIPAANAYIDGEDIVYRDYVDLSVAVATPKGLVTPVVRGVESMGIVEIEKEIATFGKKVSTRGFLLSYADIWGYYRHEMANSHWKILRVDPLRCIFHYTLYPGRIANVEPNPSSNGGVFGSLYGTPIINPPQAAVLGKLTHFDPQWVTAHPMRFTGMHSIKDRPVVVNGQIVIRPIMIVALTYDHRIMDGREAVTFLGRFSSPSHFVYCVHILSQ
jgi:2-oxoglutarate dehydrogenase E2 component (dihydrolipoamide succinyltransferase)